MTLLRMLMFVGTVALVPVWAFAGDRPGPDAKSMLEVVSNLEKLGYGPFTEVEFDDGKWEVEVYKEGTEHELKIDPLSGKIVSEKRDPSDDPRPSDEMKPLSEILQSLQKAGFEPIVEACFERHYWEVEAYQNDSKRELHVDPMTAKVTSNRPD